MKERNYIFRGWLLALLVTLGLFGVSFIPTVEVFGLKLERVDLLSDLRDNTAEEPVEYEADIAHLEEVLAEMELTREVVADTLPELPSVRYQWLVSQQPSLEHAALRSEVILPDTTLRVVPIEDFDTIGESRFDRLVEKLANGEPVRIAFMGDSFVEGDILTSDLRNELQELFGGRGVGFVPCDIPFATVRRTVKRRSTGWSSYSVMKPKAAPEHLRDIFFVSGYLSEGGVGATTRWQTVGEHSRLDSCTEARVLLLARDSSRVELTLNDTLRHEVALAGDERLREISVEGEIASLAVKVLEGKVVCYGASLEGDGGVTLDNFSVRSNNGHAIFGTGAAINRQADDMLGYDLVVLQYGLNIMLPNQRNFSKYRDQLRDMIAYVERCFPEAAILVLGVSDRWIKDDESGRYKPIGSVDALTRHQRAAADSCNVAFWNTSAAMAELGGMPAFVSNGWAAGDYTHINYGGGRRVAKALAAALREPVGRILYEREEMERLRQERLRISLEHQTLVEERIGGVSFDMDTTVTTLAASDDRP